MNGEISYAPDTEQPFDLGTVAYHECNPSFALVGPRNRTCVEDNLVGVFTESAPTCERKHFCVIIMLLRPILLPYLLYQSVVTIQCCSFSNSNCL